MVNLTHTVVVLIALASAACARRESNPSPASRVTEEEAPRLGFSLPPSATSYREHSSGLQATMLQARFEINAADLPLLENRLPCRLGPASSGQVEIATVGTNDRAWYHPESARRHRACTTENADAPSLHNTSVLVDVGQPQRPTVYVLVTDD